LRLVLLLALVKTSITTIKKFNSKLYQSYKNHFTFKSSSVKRAQYGSTEAQNLFGVSFLAVDVFINSKGGISSTTPSGGIGFYKIKEIIT
jgi:Tfp pilus assembly protein FimT